MPVDTIQLSWAVLVPDEDDDPAHTWIGPSEAQDLAIGKPQPTVSASPHRAEARILRIL